MSRDEIAIQRLATDPHSPPEFRCNQVVKNLDIYHETFGTNEADEMWLEPKDGPHVVMALYSYGPIQLWQRTFAHARAGTPRSRRTGEASTDSV